jgi:hypothetical protein
VTVEVRCQMGTAVSVFRLAVRMGCGVRAIAGCGRLQCAAHLGIGGVLEASRFGVLWKWQ